MRVFIIILTLLLFSACSSKKSYILYSHDTLASNHALTGSISVKTIELPQYLLGREIPFLENKNEISYLKNRKWATYLDEHLTNRVISTLQKSFNTPKVYKYPQKTEPNTLIKITINKFIAQKNSVILDATWSKNGESKLFFIEIPIFSKDDVVDGMNMAFSALEKELVKDIDE